MPPPSPAIVRKIVELVLADHPPECIFADDAIERIVASIPLLCASRRELHDHLRIAIRAEELYCPHEGIDRRHAPMNGHTSRSVRVAPSAEQ